MADQLHRRALSVITKSHEDQSDRDDVAVPLMQGYGSPRDQYRGQRDSPVSSSSTSSSDSLPSPTSSKLRLSGLLSSRRLVYLASLLLVVSFLVSTRLEYPLAGYSLQSQRFIPDNYTATGDIETFFVPHKITPARWVNEDRDYHCFDKWRNAKQVKPGSQALVDFEKEYPKSGCPVFPIPDGGFLFHVFWGGVLRPFNWITLDSFLATQRLSAGHKLVYWILEANVKSWQPAIDRYAHDDFAPYIEFRIFDATTEAAGTCMETMPEFADEAVRATMPYTSFANLVRVLVLHKYGGVWMDGDVLLLRDLTPYLRMGASVPGIAGSTRYNNHFIVAGPAGSSITTTFLETACSIPWDKERYTAKYPEAIPEPWVWAYNDGLFKVCEKYTRCGFTRSALSYVDIWWDQEGLPSLHPCEVDRWGAPFTKSGPGPAQLYGPFAWHARLQKNNDDCVLDWTLPNALQAYNRTVNAALQNGLSMDGRSLFPGLPPIQLELE